MTIPQRVVVRFLRLADEPRIDPHAAQVAFNLELAKLCQRLKRDASATGVATNYKGTGRQKHKRQLWIHFKSGAVIDIWLEDDFVGLGGVVKNAVPGTNRPLPKGIPYGGRPPAAVYANLAAVLKEWAAPA